MSRSTQVIDFNYFLIRRVWKQNKILLSRKCQNQSHLLYIPGLKNLRAMLEIISNNINNKDFIYKIINQNQIKLNPLNSKAYTNITKKLKKAKVDFHTYQMKKDKAYRVILRHVHHSVDIEEIKNILAEKGHKVRNIYNMNHKIIKDPLSLYYIDLEYLSIAIRKFLIYNFCKMRRYSLNHRIKNTKLSNINDARDMDTPSYIVADHIDA